MMEQGEIWTMDNDKRYTVASIVEEQGKKYVYLMDRETIGDFIIAEYDGDEIKEVDSPDIYEAIIVKFNDDLKANLPRLIAENI